MSPPSSFDEEDSGEPAHNDDVDEEEEDDDGDETDESAESLFAFTMLCNRCRLFSLFMMAPAVAVV